MPSVSKKQHNLMAAVANDPAFAKKVGIPMSVGEDFMQADKSIKFGKNPPKERPDLQRINRPKTLHGKSTLFAKGGEMKETKAMAKKEIAFMERKGAPKSMVKHEKEEYGMKKGGVAKMAKGGITTAKMGSVTSGGKRPHGEHTVQQKGHTRAMMPKMSGSKPLGMKKGGKC